MAGSIRILFSTDLHQSDFFFKLFLRFGKILFPPS